MGKLMVWESICLEEVDGDLFVDSLQVAEHFEKRHDNVIRDIENIECSQEFRALNFEVTSYRTAQGKKTKKFLMTRDGFSFLVMGFTGAKAAEWKEQYIKAFNEMEKALLHIKGPEWALKRLEGKAVRKQLTDTIKDFVKYAADQGSETYKESPHLAYIQFTKMEYSALFLLKKAMPDLRDKIDLMDHNSLVSAERGVGRCIKECMDKGMNYKDIYQECKKRVLQLADFVGTSDVSVKYLSQGPDGDDE